MSDCINIFNTDKKYQIIYADPPWEYKESGSGSRVVSSHYQTMSIEEIKKLPVKNISSEKSMLFLWVTFPKLEYGLATIKAWGFNYFGLGFDWIKLYKNGKPCFGMGYYTRQNTEICLIGVKDKPYRIKPLVRNVSSVIRAERREHSRKPDCVRDYIVKICGNIPRIELFARQKVEGWDYWGNEVNKW